MDLLAELPGRRHDEADGPFSLCQLGLVHDVHDHGKGERCCLTGPRLGDALCVAWRPQQRASEEQEALVIVTSSSRGGTEQQG